MIYLLISLTNKVVDMINKSIVVIADNKQKGQKVSNIPN
jgi:hypothetical protein